MDTCGASTFWLLWIMLLWTWVYRYLFETLLSILLDIYPEVALLDHMVVLFFIFWVTIVLFSIEVAPFYIPISGVQGFQFIHILANTCYIVFFLFVLFFWIIAILMGVRWYLIMILTRISLVISDFEHLLMCLLGVYVYIFFGEMSSKPFAIL